MKELMRFIKHIDLPIGSDWVYFDENGNRIVITNTERGKIITSSVGYDFIEIDEFNKILLD